MPLVEQSPFALIEANHRLASRFYGHSGSVRDLDGALAVFSGSNSTAFNISSLTGPTRDLPGLLQRINTHYDGLGTGSSIWMCEQYAAQPDLSLMQLYGYRFQQSAPGLLVERMAAARRVPPSELTIRRVTTGEETLQFAHLVSVIFHVSFPLCQQIYGDPGRWRAPIHGFLAYRLEEPVGCAMIAAEGGVVGYYSVGILPHYQGRGYGETLMRSVAAYAETHFGGSVSVLQSSPAGRKLYERLGFGEHTRFSIFNRQPV